MTRAALFQRSLPVIAGLLVACNDSPTAPNPDLDGDAILNVADDCPSAAEVVNGVFDTDGCPDTPADFYQVVRADVEAYWTATLAPLFPYPPVGTFLGYTAPLGSPCGPLVLNNAFYCPANAGVYFDGTFMGAYLAAVGDMAPAFIISHEIGHHVSWLLGWVPPVISTKENELQADCFGGAWARSADDRGLLDEGDLEEAVVALISVGDPDYTWFDPTGHGTPLQRVSAFAMGFDGGPPACTNQAFFDAFPANSP